MAYSRLPVAHGEMKVGKIEEPRLTPGGKKVLAVWFVQESQKKDDTAQSGYSKDKELWVRITFWEQEAERVLGSIQKGDFVVLTYEFWQESYDHREKGKVFFIEGRCTMPLALSTRFRTYPHAAHNAQSNGGGQQQSQQQAKSPAAQAEAQGRNENATDDQGNYVRPDDEPPF